MSKQDVIDYVFETPHNTNPAILNQKLDELVEESGGSGGGGSATEPYVEETYDSNGNLINANLVGYTKIRDHAFHNCQNLALTSLPSGITNIGNYAFQGCTKLTSITFEGTPNSIISNTAFSGCTDLTTINVPWAKNEVANAPWGATNATINYNYGVSEEEILSETTFTFGDNSFPFGDYLMSENSASASLVEGKNYVVTMDGNDYNCTAYADSNRNGFICLDIDSTFSYANGYMLSNDLSYVGSKTISIKLVS